VNYVNQAIFESVRQKLRSNKEARIKRGALTQDFECLRGEVFYGNLTQAEFDALPLTCKRKGDLAHLAKITSKKMHNVNRVFIETYEERYGDRESFAVFVHTYELTALGIEY
jgi:hypothetical protein